MKKITLVTLSFLSAFSLLFADAKETAKAEIGRQFELLKKGDTTGLKARFTARLKERITADKVKRAQREVKSYSLSDLVDSAIEGQYQGKKTIKIKMKNGRTLTTLVNEGNEWYADTLWFK